MLYPINPAHNPRSVRTSQRIMVPTAGRKFVFTKVPGGSYASVNEVYVCSGYPNTADKWTSHDIAINCADSHVGTFDRLSAWEYAEWHYVD